MQRIVELVSGRGCADCGETDPVVLEFDHVRGVKAANISRMVSDLVGLGRIEAEIEKCDVVCANCHRRRTARSFWNKNNPKHAPVVQRQNPVLVAR